MNTNHIVMPLHDSTIKCLHCGMNFKLTMPIPVKEFVRYAEQFIQEHKDCEATKTKETVVRWKWGTESWGITTLHQDYLTEAEARIKFADYFGKKNRGCTKADWSRKEFQE